MSTKPNVPANDPFSFSSLPRPEDAESRHLRFVNDMVSSLLFQTTLQCFVLALQLLQTLPNNQWILYSQGKAVLGEAEVEDINETVVVTREAIVDIEAIELTPRNTFHTIGRILGLIGQSGYILFHHLLLLHKFYQDYVSSDQR